MSHGWDPKNIQMKNTQNEEYSALAQASALPKKDPAHIRYLVERILEVCRDTKSARFYSQVARALPDQVILRFLSEIKDDETIKNRGAVFTFKVKAYANRDRSPHQPLGSGSSSKQP